MALLTQLALPRNRPCSPLGPQTSEHGACLSFKRIKCTRSLAPANVRKLQPDCLKLPIRLMRTSQTATKTQLPRQTGEGFAPWGPVCLRKTQSTVCAERDQLPARERAGSRLPLDSRQDFEGPDNIRHLSSPQHLRVFAVFFNKKMQVPTKAYYNNSLCAPDSHAHWLLLSLYYYFF